MEIIKVHARSGVEMYLNTRYIVRFTDHSIIVDDHVFDPDIKIPEAKHLIRVFETANEIANMIDGRITVAELDKKYATDFEEAKKDSEERTPF